MRNPRDLLFIILVCTVVLFICCICVIGGICISTLSAMKRIPDLNTTISVLLPQTRVFSPSVTSTPQFPDFIPSTPTTQINPTMSPPSVFTPTAPITPESSENLFLLQGEDTLTTFQNANIPIADPIDLAERLEGKQDLPTSLEFQVKTYQVGDQENFWVNNGDTNETFQVEATLHYITEHVYFWIENGISSPGMQIKALVDTFENEIYPTNREFFGSEWITGVDADPHLFILYVRGLGGRVAGYFSPADEYLPIVREDSNGHEMFFISADSIELDQQYAYSVLAHEFQHMIHWYRDRNEDIWMNEGFADLAMLLNGYTVGGVDHIYVNDPDIQLNTWPAEPSSRAAHYGASFLFMTYFLDRFGEEVTKALVANPLNGLVSIDNTLVTLGISDPSTGKNLGADDVFSDWVIATYLQDEDVEDGRFAYHNYPGVPNPFSNQDIRSCPTESYNSEVSQYGVDYVRIRCRGNYTLHFEGLQQVRVVPENPHSGSYMFYSNRGDESDMTLTRYFDFTDYSGPLSLTYWTWYDLEKDYDYLYLTASLDDENWQILTTPSGTAENPSGNSYGWGYNGKSGGEPQWIQEKVDISQFAGQQVNLRFEYVTDGAVNEDGFLLDDISIPEINYISDFEEDDGDWHADGFVRIQNVLPQTFRLSLININSKTNVEKFELSQNTTIDIPIHIEDELILVISGTTRFTTQKATYQFSILQ